MIKNLLIDLGGVIMGIHRQDCVDAFKAMGFEDVDKYLTDFAQIGFFEALEEGRITPGEFRAEIRSHISRPVTDAEIDRAFEAFLTGIPRRRLEALRSLRRRGLGLYLLSNTNSIMWDGRIAADFRAEGLTVNDYFDGILTSFQAGVQKPSPLIFEIAAERFGLTPSTTLFVDDSQTNLDAAASLGFRTLLARPDAEFDTLILSYLDDEHPA